MKNITVYAKQLCYLNVRETTTIYSFFFLRLTLNGPAEKIILATVEQIYRHTFLCFRINV